MSNSEPLSLICVINACRQPFGCSLSKAEKLFTFLKIAFMALLLRRAIKNSLKWQERWAKESLGLVCSVTLPSWHVQMTWRLKNLFTSASIWWRSVSMYFCLSLDLDETLIRSALPVRDLEGTENTFSQLPSSSEQWGPIWTHGFCHSQNSWGIIPNVNFYCCLLVMNIQCNYFQQYEFTSSCTLPDVNFLLQVIHICFILPQRNYINILLKRAGEPILRVT